MYKGSFLDVHKPLLKQAVPNCIISVGKKCSILIQWNNEKKFVDYVSCTPCLSIIEFSMKVFNISIPIEQLYLLTIDRKEVNVNQTIPFNGYPCEMLILYRKSNMTPDSSDDSNDEDIFICYEDDINTYPYDQNKTIKKYFHQYLQDTESTDMENDSCFTTKNLHFYNFSSTLGDLRIKPKDTLYFTSIEDVDESCIWIYHQAQDKLYDYHYDMNKTVGDYISFSLKVISSFFFYL